MSSIDSLEGCLPYLRRYARAVAGNADTGDAYVEDLLTALLDAGLDSIKGDAKIAFFRQLDAAISTPAAAKAGSAPPRSPAASRLAAKPRRAQLLVTMEGFSIAAAADVMRVPVTEIADLLGQAEQDVGGSAAQRVLIIEDEAMIAAHLSRIVSSMGHEIAGIAVTRDEAVKLAETVPIDLILADIQLADGSSGSDAVDAITSHHDLPVVYITAFPERLLTGQGIEPAYLIAKPFREDAVRAIISQALLVQAGG